MILVYVYRFGNTLRFPRTCDKNKSQTRKLVWLLSLTTVLIMRSLGFPVINKKDDNCRNKHDKHESA